MSTAERGPWVARPPLVEGDRLDRATFHERYAAMPESTRAELIGGVVHLTSPMGRKHGWATGPVGFWLGYYAEFTPGVEVLENATIWLEDSGEPQPDLLVRILPGKGGRTRDEGIFVAGGPELIVEVADSTLANDLGLKREDYERAGVPEYVVLAVDPPAIRWHRLREDRLVEVGPDEDGLYRSTIFPGLWLDPAALLAGDTRALRAVIDRGVATVEHGAFTARMAQAGGPAGG